MSGRSNIPEELLLHVARRAVLDGSYVVFMATAGVLSAVAMLANSVPMLIGAMVVAPVFSPLALVTFGLVAGQWRLALRGLGTAVLGLGVAAAFAMLAFWVFHQTGGLVERSSIFDYPLLEERVRPGWYSVAAAFAAGIAGTLATLKDRLDTLVGIVAAVALVPAGAAAAISLLSEEPLRAMGGLVLLGINVGLIIACGILVLVVVGPRQQEG